MSVVSLCIIRIEISSDTEETLEMSTKCNKTHPMRGRRQVRNIEVETYTNRGCSSESSSLLGDLAEVKSHSSKSNAEKEDGNKDKSDQISFMSGNPIGEMAKGILHLYKEDSLTVVDPDTFNIKILCILAVPATMTCGDLLSFTGAWHNGIQRIRIIRDGSINQYMALIYFRSTDAIVELYNALNGAPFTSLEPDCLCQLVYVSRVEIVKEGECDSLVPSDHTELPTCAVCLERMDESVDGILTILCNHSFHGNCLIKWGDSSCPVCRYVQTPELVAENKCVECQSSENLWICLICGYVGCGRYVEGHAHRHYVETAHCYSMQMGTNRVWDYVGDNFVHRLLQNKTDGKLVEGPCPNKNGQTQNMDEKIDSVQLEYTYLLTSQLESQRVYYERIISKAKQKASSDSDKGIKKLATEKQLLDTKLNSVMREKNIQDKKIQQLTARLGQTQSDLNDEKQMTVSLQMNQATWQKKFADLENEFKDYKASKELELTELKEQLRDIMFYFEAQKSIAQSDVKDEITGGSMMLPDQQSSKDTTTKSARRMKRR